MKTIFITLLIFVSYPLIAQINSLQKKEYHNMLDSKKGAYSIGLNANNFRIVDGISNPNKVQELHTPSMGFRFSYNPARKLAVGLEYSAQFIWGTYIPKTQWYSYAGAFMRYDIWRKRNAFYLEASYALSNIAWRNTGGWERKNGISYLGAGFGIRAKLYPNIYFNYSQTFLFPLADSRMYRDERFGLIYVWHPKVKDTPLLVVDDKKDRSNKFVIGFSAAFIPFDEYDFDGGYNSYETITRVGYYQSSFLSFGIYNRFMIGDSQIPNYPTQYFYFTGPFVNFKLFGLKRFNLFAEFAYLRSNFTLVSGGTGTELPQKGNALYYSVTTGVSYRINNNLALEFGINTSTAIKSNTGGYYGAGGYRIGIEKTFTLKRRETVSGF